MFDLEENLAKWRRQMLAAGIKTPVPLVELEGHLREEIDQQRQWGLGAEAAFHIAVQRLGSASALKAEFVKVAAPGLPQRYLCLYCLLAAPLLVFVNLWALPTNEASPILRCCALTAMSLMALYIGGLPYWYKRLPSARNQLVSMVMWIGCVTAMAWPLTATGMALGMVPLTVGIGAEMTIWSLGAAWFATCLAYWVRGEIDGAAETAHSDVSG